ncbi:thioesterase family protein [Fusobacterium sp. PH5-44]|uniref:thioesterase family protein n=1 Tax=unclassified Fusobacterium TaxID=2648384 RepID=UPI003D1F0AE8
MLKEGMILTEDKVVEEKETAKNIGSGNVEVYSTPMMIAFMENTALKLVQNELADGEATVGTAVNITHLKANAVGDKVKCTAILEKIEGKKLSFLVKVTYNDEVIGEGTHERFIINEKKFMEKVKR